MISTDARTQTERTRYCNEYHFKIRQADGTYRDAEIERSWKTFFEAMAIVDYSEGESVHEFDDESRRLWEVFAGHDRCPYTVQHQTIIPNPITTTVGFATLREARITHAAINPTFGILANASSGNWEITFTKSEIVKYFAWYIEQAPKSEIGS